jgi:hypothetical protein
MLVYQRVYELYIPNFFGLNSHLCVEHVFIEPSRWAHIQVPRVH